MTSVVKRFMIIFAVSAIVFLLTDMTWSGSNHKVGAELKSFEKAIAIWHMNGGINDILANSKKAGGHSLHMPVMVDGRFDKAGYFDGKKSYVETSITTDMLQSGLTISLWVRPWACIFDDACVIIDTGHSKDENFTLQSTNKRADEFAWYANDSAVIFEVPHDRWSHLLLVLDAKNNIISGYKDGYKMPPVFGKKKFKWRTAGLTLGRATDKNERYFMGGLDEIVIWDHVLKNEEIEALLNYYHNRQNN